MSFLSNLAHRGCRCQPTGRGNYAGFYPRMFIPGRFEWESVVKSHTQSGLDLQAEIDESTGNGTSIGMVYTEESGDFVYLYEIDAYGNRCSVAFTHKVIANGGEKE